MLRPVRSWSIVSCGRCLARQVHQSARLTDERARRPAPDKSPQHPTRGSSRVGKPARPDTITTTSPKSRSDWKYLPDWRRQNLSIKHKLKQMIPRDQEEADEEDEGPRGGGGRGVAASEYWSPRKKLSPDAMDGIRALQRTNPEYTVPRIAELFKVSPDAIRRILKSKWVPNPQEARDRQERWKKRRLTITQAKQGG